MSNDYTMTVANTIAQQLGGGRVKAMLGNTRFTAVERDGLPGLNLKFSNRQRSRGNCVEILLNGSDLYDVTFYNVTRKSCKKIKVLNDVFVEDLIPFFEEQTGLYLRL